MTEFPFLQMSSSNISMFGVKRAYNTSKVNVNRYSSKGKDSPKQSTSRQKSFDTHVSDNETVPVVFPLIKQVDNARVLPRYSLVLGRTAEDGVGMEDLDQLQQDFEKLLSTCAVRNRLLRSEVESIDRVEEKREKKGKPFDKPSLKRKRPDEKLKCKDTKNGSRILKTKHYSLGMNSFISELPLKQEVPKVMLPRNDTSDKFWSSIEPYCADISKDDVNFLDELIQECSQEISVKIPEVGEHYAMEWAESALNQEQNLSAVGRPPKTKVFGNDLKKNGINSMVDTFSSPLTQRLLAALLEEKVMKSYPTVFDKLKVYNTASDFTIKNSNGARGGICLDRRLRKELVEQGILDVDELSKTFQPEDDILLEIKKCQQELTVVNEHNISELKKLRTNVSRDIRRQEVKAALNKVDNQVMNIYNTILMAKQKPVATDDDDDDSYDKSNRMISHEYEEEASEIIKQQILLHKELSELTDFSLLQ